MRAPVSPDPSEWPESPPGIDLLAIFFEVARLGKTNAVQALTRVTGGSDHPFMMERDIEKAILKLEEEVPSQYILSFPQRQNATGAPHQTDDRRQTMAILYSLAAYLLAQGSDAPFTEAIAGRNIHAWEDDQVVINARTFPNKSLKANGFCRNSTFVAGPRVIDPDINMILVSGRTHEIRAAKSRPSASGNPRSVIINSIGSS
jgi:hypothetical protein